MPQSNEQVDANKKMEELQREIELLKLNQKKMNEGSQSEQPAGKNKKKKGGQRNPPQVPGSPEGKSESSNSASDEKPKGQKKVPNEGAPQRQKEKKSVESQQQKNHGMCYRFLENFCILPWNNIVPG